MLRTNYADRLTAEEVLEHPWLQTMVKMQKDKQEEKQEVETMAKLVQISNPAILNSMRFYQRKSNVLHDEVLKLLGDCNYLNVNQREALKDFLTATDQNSDNKISKDELLTALKKVDDEITMKDVNSIFMSLDIDKDGTVSYEELLTSRINRKLKSKESRLKKVFTSFDYNDDGKITVKELEAAWESVQRNSVKKNDFAAIIKEVDINGDGMIDYEEFLLAFDKSRRNSAKANVVSVKINE